MAKLSRELNQVFKILVCRRHCQSFLKGLHVPGFSITLPEVSIPASPGSSRLLPAAIGTPGDQFSGLHRGSRGR